MEAFVDSYTSEKKVAAIKVFHDEFEGVWNFKEEHAKYLQQDVRLLRGGCVSLIQASCFTCLFITIVNIIIINVFNTQF